MRGALAAGLMLTALAACGGEPVEETSGLQRFGVEVPGSCIDNSDCGPGQSCKSGVCVSGVPAEAPGASCTRDSDCAAGQACKSGVCVDQWGFEDEDGCPEPDHDRLLGDTEAPGAGGDDDVPGLLDNVLATGTKDGYESENHDLDQDGSSLPD